MPFYNKYNVEMLLVCSLEISCLNYETIVAIQIAESTSGTIASDAHV